MQTIQLQNDFMRIVALPELGCKIISIYDIVHDHEWLWKDSWRPLKTAEFGARYEDFDISGFDECFPNIGSSIYPLDSEVMLPDHGDLWSIPWNVNSNHLSMVAEVDGRSLPYLFTRRLELSGSIIKFHYQVRNKKDSNIVFIWSAHPLFSATGDMRVLLNDAPKMTKEFGFGGRLGSDGMNGYRGQHQVYDWPYSLSDKGVLVDLSYIKSEGPITDKVVLRSPLDGEIALEHMDSGRILSFRFSPIEIPYVGLCFNLGAWPFGVNPGTWVAIELTTGCTDKLSDSFARGVATTLATGETKSWSYEIELG